MTMVPPAGSFTNPGLNPIHLNGFTGDTSTSYGPTLGSISPTSGSQGMTLTLHGVGFTNLPLDAGGKPLIYFLSSYGYPRTSPDDATVVLVNDTTITCTLPYLDPFYDTPNTYYVGIASVTVNVPAGQPPPVIPSVQPLTPL